MKWPWSKFDSGKVVEGGLNILESAAAAGLFSSAAFAAALGKFFLGGILAVLALGVMARLTRRKNVRASSEKSLGANY